ncbi:MAG: helix-turn-helix transcriptional regulator [Methylobacter sp.]|jgi:transcriptional regulator with XRE-family HTH domain
MLDTFPQRLSHAINVIKARTRKTKQQIAEEIGISPAALTQLTKGKSKQASESTLNSLKQEYSLSPDWLTEGRGDIFIATDGFENLRPEIIAETDKYGGRCIVATTLGWGKILNYYYTERRFDKKLTMELARKINNWPGVLNNLRPLHGSPIFLRNYDSSHKMIMFYLEGTPPRGYMITQLAQNVPHELIQNSEKRVFLSCRCLFDANWKQIKLADEYDYIVDLSHRESLDILSTQPPKDVLQINWL